jgi:chemotaxis protein methyltransferase CheR
VSLAVTTTGGAPPLKPVVVVGANEISPQDFAFLQALLADQAAIVLEEGKEYLAESRLGSVARAEGLASIAELLDVARRERRGPTVDKVIDAMTTNETSFFRDVKPFDVLASTILPELIASREAVGRRQLDIWCMASSTGQEPYSLAMLLAENFPSVVDSWNVRIFGTDISSSVVERAHAGRFSQLEISRGLPASYLVRYFERDGLDWQVSAKLRAMCRFDLMNLAAPWPPTGRFDLVLCRNVLIYFSMETKKDILQRVRNVLAPDGHLLLGSSETTMNIDDGWVRRPHDRVSTYQTTRDR